MLTMAQTPVVDLDAASRRLYDAEVALHVAHTSRVDAWIKAASERLHEAVVAHIAAAAAVAGTLR